MDFSTIHSKAKKASLFCKFFFSTVLEFMCVLVFDVKMKKKSFKGRRKKGYKETYLECLID